MKIYCVQEEVDLGSNIVAVYSTEELAVADTKRRNDKWHAFYGANQKAENFFYDEWDVLEYLDNEFTI